MKKYLYHVTPVENTQSIVNNGLIRRGAFVCLSEDKNSWMRPGHSLFRINIEEYVKDHPDTRVTTWLPESDEVCVWEDINRKYVELVK